MHHVRCKGRNAVNMWPAMCCRALRRGVFLVQRSQARSSAGSQQKKAGAGRGKGDTGHKGSKGSKKGMKRSASFAFGPAEGEMGMRRRSVNVSQAFKSHLVHALQCSLQHVHALV